MARSFQHLLTGNQEYSNGCRRIAKTTIKYLQKNNKKININSVANASGLSRQFFYNHEDLVELIKSNEEAQKRNIKIRNNTSEKSKDTQIACLHKEIDKLKEKLKQKDITIQKLQKENNFLKRLKYEDLD